MKAAERLTNARRPFFNHDGANAVGAVAKLHSIANEPRAKVGRPSLAAENQRLLLFIMLFLVEGCAATVREATLKIAALDGERVATVESRAKRLERAFWGYLKANPIIVASCRSPHLRRILTPRTTKSRSFTACSN
jgi:hypothetical protein